MPEDFIIRPVAHIQSDFPDKFGIPRQSGLVPALEARIVFDAPYRNADAVRGLDEYSHIWLIWQFSQALRKGFSPTVRPPRLGGNVRMGVFATRSPFRPNPLGLSCVRLLGIENGPVLRVAGADLLDGTPIYDIKPYLPYADAIPEATGGFTDRVVRARLDVVCSPSLLSPLPSNKRQTLLDVLAQDPRPSYQEDPERIYGLTFSGVNVRFTVNSGVLTVQQVEKVR